MNDSDALFLTFAAYVVAIPIILAILFAVIRAAVLAALHSHYKTVRRFELTGEWIPKFEDASRKPVGRNAGPKPSKTASAPLAD